ncbi:MAG: LytTR family DNA-binding domain-containing protein [Maribacter sp.]
MILNIPFEKSKKVYLYIGFFTAIWIYLFLVFVGPYDASALSIGWRAQIMVGYGILFLLTHLTVMFLQHLLYIYVGVWNTIFEIASIFLIFVVFLPISFGYYKSEVILGDYAFGHYLNYMYLPTLIVLVPLVVLLRWTFTKFIADEQKPVNTFYEIRGENKNDILRLPFSKLLCVIASSNYIEVYYLEGDTLHKKLLRTTLSKIHGHIPDLVKSHRSYLFNPEKFVKWEGKNKLRLFHMVIPVSRNYKSNVRVILSTRP